VFKEVHGLDAAKLAALGTNNVPEKPVVLKANMDGDRDTLKADSVIPMIMAAIYLGMIFYFRSRGGYKAVHIVETKPAEHKAEATV
jgi:hypothetical protein